MILIHSKIKNDYDIATKSQIQDMSRYLIREKLNNANLAAPKITQIR